MAQEYHRSPPLLLSSTCAVLLFEFRRLFPTVAGAWVRVLDHGHTPSPLPTRVLFTSSVVAIPESSRPAELQHGVPKLDWSCMQDLAHLISPLPPASPRTWRSLASSFRWSPTAPAPSGIPLTAPRSPQTPSPSPLMILNRPLPYSARASWAMWRTERDAQLLHAPHDPASASPLSAHMTASNLPDPAPV